MHIKRCVARILQTDAVEIRFFGELVRLKLGTNPAWKCKITWKTIAVVIGDQNSRYCNYQQDRKGNKISPLTVSLFRAVPNSFYPWCNRGLFGYIYRWKPKDTRHREFATLQDASVRWSRKLGSFTDCSLKAPPATSSAEHPWCDVEASGQLVVVVESEGSVDVREGSGTQS